MTDCAIENTTRKATVEDYKADRLFCQFTINVSEDGIVINAHKDVRICHIQKSVVSEAGHAFSGFGRISYVRLGEVMSTGAIPLREQRGFVIDYMDNYEQAKRAAVAGANAWRDDLVAVLAKTAANLQRAAVSITE